MTTIPVLALDHVHVREVEAAQLVEARAPARRGPRSRLSAPGARGSGWRSRGQSAVEEVVGGDVPDGPAALALDDCGLEGRDQAASRLGEVGVVDEGQRGGCFAVLRRGPLRCRLARAAHGRRGDRCEQRRRAVGLAVLALAGLRAARQRCSAPIRLGELERAERPVEAEPHRGVHVGGGADLLFEGEGRLVGDLGDEAGEDLGGGGVDLRQLGGIEGRLAARVPLAVARCRGYADWARLPRRSRRSRARSCGRAGLPRPVLPGSGWGASAPARRPGRRRSGRR